MNSKQNRRNGRHQDRYRIHSDDAGQPKRPDAGEMDEAPSTAPDEPLLPEPVEDRQQNPENAEEVSHASSRSDAHEAGREKTETTRTDEDHSFSGESGTANTDEPGATESAPDEDEQERTSAAETDSGEDKPDTEGPDRKPEAKDGAGSEGPAVPGRERPKPDMSRADAAEVGKAGRVKDDSPRTSRPDDPHNDKKQADTGTTGKRGRTKNLGSFYLGLAAAFLVAALGLSLSTLPIFFSIPLAAVLFGIGIWLLSYASLQSPDQAPEPGSGTDRHTTTVVITAVLLVLQTFIMDVFIFTRMGSVQKYQNPVIITWILATVVETIAAFALIYRHNPSSKAPKPQPKEDDGQQENLPPKPMPDGE